MSRGDPTFSHSGALDPRATMDPYHHRQFSLLIRRCRSRCPNIEFQTVLALLTLECLRVFESKGAPQLKLPATGAKLGAIDGIFIRPGRDLVGRRKPQLANGRGGIRYTKECGHPWGWRESFDATGGSVDSGSVSCDSGDGECGGHNEKTHFLDFMEKKRKFNWDYILAGAMRGLFNTRI